MLAMLVGSLMAGVGVGASAPAPAGELRATFIGNAAFHITDGRVAVLIDFPYESGASGSMEWSRAVVPKGPSPLCVISHSHADHFTPRLAREFCGTLLGPRDVVQGSGVAALALKDEVRWEGLSIHPLRTPHGDVEHYSYLIEWGGKRLYFTGDTDDTSALLAARGLDVAFVTPWLLKATHAEGRRIDAGQIIVYHHRAGEVVPEIQGRLVPSQGDVFALGSDEAPVRVVEAGPEVLPKADVDEFEKRLREASGDVKTPAGLAYFEGAFSKQFYPTYSPRLSACMQQTGETPRSFDLVLDLDGDGRVEDAMVRPETKLTTCFMALVKKDQFPPPPSAHLRVPVLVRFTTP
jgi:L-ascorbate metabolism protein UlaG (beta-lactamase superfamily)